MAVAYLEFYFKKSKISTVRGTHDSWMWLLWSSPWHRPLNLGWEEPIITDWFTMVLPSILGHRASETPRLIQFTFAKFSWVSIYRPPWKKSEWLGGLHAYTEFSHFLWCSCCFICYFFRFLLLLIFLFCNVIDAVSSVTDDVLLLPREWFKPSPVDS